MNEIICSECGNTSQRIENFQDISLPIYSNKSVYESLKSETTYELLEGDNQYFCDNCDKKVNAKKGRIFQSLPKILLLCLNRFEYDLQTFNRIKNLNHYKFPLVLDMAPYCEHSSVKFFI